MKKIKKILAVVVISFIFVIFLSLFFETEMAVGITLVLDGIYIIYLILKNYVISLKKYNEDGTLPKYMDWILIFTTVAFVSGKDFNMRLLTIRSVGSATSSLMKKRKVNVLIYSLITLGFITFFSFLFFIQILDFTTFKDGMNNLLLTLTFLIFASAILITLFTFIYDVCCAKFSKKIAVFVIFLISIPLCIAIFGGAVPEIINHFKN